VRFRRSLVAFVLVACLPGCTLLGLGTGATVDALAGPYYTEKPAREVRPLELGERIRATTSRGVRVEGRYAGLRAPNPRDPETYLLVRESDDNQVELRYSEVTRIGVEKPGRGWLYGTLIGLGLDVATVVALAVAQPDFAGGGWGGGTTLWQ
jgi:hypothetical protein